MPIVVTLLILLFASCSLFESGKGEASRNKMYVYSNTAQKFYLVDYRTFEVVKDIPLAMPEGVYIYGMTLSTDRNHLFFRTHGPFNESPLGFAIFDIEKEKFKSAIFTQFIHSGPVSFIAAQKESAPGRIFAHLRDSGLYVLDLFEQQIVETISEEHNFRLLRLFKQWSDKKWTVIHHRFSGTGGFHELQFYSHDSGLHEPEFVLNEAGKDSIAIYDFEFSRDGERLFLTYQLSDGRSRNIESYFGSYDLQTGELYESNLRFPWSLNPYYTAYSPKRNEVYTIGAYREFHIIDTETYERKETIVLSGKTQGPSRIQLTPDENTAFISCALDNAIFVIDLNRREVIHTIDILEQPYTMIIP